MGCYKRGSVLCVSGYEEVEWGELMLEEVDIFVRFGLFEFKFLKRVN